MLPFLIRFMFFLIFSRSLCAVDVAVASDFKVASPTVVVLMGTDRLVAEVDMDRRQVDSRGTAVGMRRETRNDRAIERRRRIHQTFHCLVSYRSSPDLTATICMHASCLNGLGRHDFFCVSRSRGM